MRLRQASSEEKELIKLIMDCQNTMEEQLHQWCAINSGTANLAGLQTMAQVLSKAYSPLADSIEIKSLQPTHLMDITGISKAKTCGDVLWIRKRPELKRRILLGGHMDTVYGSDHAFQNITYVNDNTLKGPGVTDMKGGLVVMLQALTAFEQSTEASNLGWDVLINADEEIGSPASAFLFNQLASDYEAALLYEPAINPEGMLAKNRRGSGKLTLIATGIAAHAGRSFDEGRNAICYLAKAITSIHELNGQRDGVTINVGRIAGGEALNVVPNKAIAQLDVRIPLPEDEFWVRDALDKIITQLKHPDYKLEVHGQFSRPVKRVDLKTQCLFARLQQMGKKLGLSLDWKDSGGCCDGNNLAQLGLPVLDTLGVRGGNIHSPEEYLLLDSLTERAALSTLLLIDMAKVPLEEANK